MGLHDVLRTPFEFVRVGSEYYVLTRKSLDLLVTDGGSVSSDDDLKNQVEAVLTEKLLKQKPGLRARIVVGRISRDALQFVEDVFEVRAVQISSDKNWFVLSGENESTSMSDMSDRVMVNIVIDCSGGEPELCQEVRNVPVIYYSFDLKNRYRSSIYWPYSGRPCPKCITGLYLSRTSGERRNLISASRLLGSQRPASLSEGVSLPSLAEILSCVDSAVKLGRRVNEADEHAIDELRYVECLSLVVDDRHYEVVPVDPACSHEGFVH